MVREEELSSVISLHDRQRCIEAVGAVNILEYVQERLLSLSIRPLPALPLPPALWPYVPLIVDAKGEDGTSATEYIEANETTVRLYGKQAAPALMAANYVNMDDTTMNEYVAYCSAFAEILSGRLQTLRPALAQLSERRTQLVSLLQDYYYETVSKGDRKRLASCDPFVRALTSDHLKLEHEAKAIEGHIHALQDRIRACSRDVERRKAQLQVFGITHGGTGIRRSEPPPLPTWARQRK